MQGVYVNGRRPKSKAEVRRVLAEKGPRAVRLEATSLFGDEYDGPLSEAPHKTVPFVGPDPRNKRSFYGNFVWKGEAWTVK